MKYLLQNKIVFRPLIVFWQLLANTINQYTQDRVTRLGASISFYTILSLPPIVMLGFTVLRYFFGHNAVDQVETHINEQLVEFIGQNQANVITQLAHHTSLRKSSWALTIIAIVSTIFSAQGVFSELQDALNTIWRVRVRNNTKHVVIKYLKTRLKSLIMISCIGALVLLGLIASTILRLVGENLSMHFSTDIIQWVKIGNFFISYVSMIFIFAAVFKLIPDVNLKWRNIWLGAIITTILFGLGRYFIILYLSKSELDGAYGVAGSLVILILWVFYSAQIMFLGAEFVKVYHEFKNIEVRPKRYAMRVYELERQLIDDNDTDDIITEFEGNYNDDSDNNQAAGKDKTEKKPDDIFNTVDL
ncbi:MAG: YihY/virulence factor BrkB family protein [Sphingobacteriales bacterium]|jgi:membrane protein|nr:YihY/virulence factor BrkB family protein [Sphingobacteriales bacterium]MBP9141669.1 YihY/virulence factor BrkB family protein [Chitinophagales bacterium]MDA0197478.1 YihY/virulence factor BrkB family protein [Bacteroidota bacterium]MBK6890335.1 YihY/virulence factor BrkB family protein [Sphingobacteriales bacterium]MBK7526612.1 YihY/virulence factor BrkB family protein [Sphingobacteriales bacterium]